MSDIFISYARADRSLAEALANDLKAAGYTVWWDAELVGSDDFYDVILQALHDAKATIVIWTSASVRSKFVRDEARFADHLNKLVAVKVADLEPLSIPFGFGGHHTDDITDRTQITRALDKLGAKPNAVARAVGAARRWSDVAATDRVDEIVAFLGTDPEDVERRAAVARLRLLTAASSAPKGSSELVRSALSSNWKAFLSGVSLRLPAFQLSAQMAWSSVGRGLATSVLAAIISTGVFAAVSSGAFANVPVSIAYVITGILPVLAHLGWKSFRSTLLGDALLARMFTGAMFVVTVVPAAFFLWLIVDDILIPNEGQGMNVDLSGLDRARLAATLAGAAAAILVVVKSWAARSRG